MFIIWTIRVRVFFRVHFCQGSYVLNILNLLCIFIFSVWCILEVSRRIYSSRLSVLCRFSCITFSFRAPRDIGQFILLWESWVALVETKMCSDECKHNGDALIYCACTPKLKSFVALLSFVCFCKRWAFWWILGPQMLKYMLFYIYFYHTILFQEVPECVFHFRIFSRRASFPRVRPARPARPL